jgi:hypothetical protein
VVLIGLRSGPTRTGMRSFGPKPFPPLGAGWATVGVEAVADVVTLLPGCSGVVCGRFRVR